MAWLSGLAGKAENLLNKIDQNTAAALNKDKHDLPQPILADVTWMPQQSINNSGTTTPGFELPKYSTLVLSPPNLQSVSSVGTCREEELFTFLNSPAVSPKRTVNETVISPPTPSSLLVEHSMDNTDSISELSIHSGHSSPGLTHTSVDVPDDEEHDPEGELQLENLFIRHEASSSHDTFISNVTIESAGDVVLGTQLDIVENEAKYETTPKEAELFNAVHSTMKKQYINKHLSELDRNFDNKDKIFRKQEIDYQKEIVRLKEKLQSLQFDNMQLSKQSVDDQSVIEKNKSEIISVRSELEQHRARALKTLQEKEKLIAELRTNASSGMDDAIMMELNQLRQERDSLREENQQICEQLRIVREELDNADLKLEKIRQQSTETKAQAQELLAAERRRRLDAEEDARLHSEELRSLKDEMLHQRNAFTLQLQKQDTEISRLRSQLSATSTPNSEVESRLASLTQTLVMKQQALENLTTERNALRLQLEKIEDEYRCTTGNNRRNITYNNMNDTDDAKAQVPTFLMETPFDTGVTRRVKRAYSSLDAISIRTGVFLRRYPLARILVLIYMALLQFWVLVVLVVFSQSPDAH